MCSGNKITSLNLSNNTQLNDLDCSNNNLKSLNISKNTDLHELDCRKNKIKSLDASKNKYLKCDKNVKVKRYKAK